MSTQAPQDQDSLITQLVGLTGISPAEAQGYLEAADWNLENAASLFFDGGPSGHRDTPQVSDVEDMDDDSPPRDTNPTPSQQPGGGRTLDGAYVPPSAASSSSSAQVSGSRQRPAQRGVAGLRTLRDLQSSGGGHAHGQDDDDEDDDDKSHDFFTGGEKSGLAVQNPGADRREDQINKILKRARQNVERPGGDDERPPTHFHGTGMTLGGDDAPSRAIPDPNADTQAPAPRAHRELHLWRDGFSVDDGPLFRYDDPANARTLEMINTGHAPLNILNVEHGQEVDVQVHPHRDEDYKKPKTKYVPFAGSGQRLGSPTPGASSSTAPQVNAAPAASSSISASTSAPAATIQVDDSSPTVNLQIRLGDGTRLQSRFNTTHTIGDVYTFVNAASSASQQREYALMTTFPSKELTDKSQTLGDSSDLRRGGVVVQKWK